MKNIDLFSLSMKILLMALTRISALSSSEYFLRILCLTVLSNVSYLVVDIEDF